MAVLPNQSSSVYEGPFSLTTPGSVTLKVRAFGSGIEASPVVTRNYTVVKDTTPPSLESVQALNSNTVRVVFSETVEENSASQIAHYSKSGGAVVQGVNLLEDGRRVDLTTSL